MKRRSLLGLLTATTLQFVPSSAIAGGGNSEIVYYGRTHAPGVKAEVIAVDTTAATPEGTKAVGSDRYDENAAPTVPAPIAISAHNCIPRTDGRGISLTYEFAEGTAADCLSFVSPPPVRTDTRETSRRPRRPAPQDLAHRAFERVISLAPSPDLRIAPAEIGLTGLPSYFWVAAELRPVTATAGVRGLTVTAEARPVAYLWDFGDGTERRTRHPGRAWTKNDDGNVGHVYETKGRYEPSVEVVWAARWRINQGAWSELGYFSTTDSFAYPVREMIAALVRRR